MSSSVHLARHTLFTVLCVCVCVCVAVLGLLVVHELFIAECRLSLTKMHRLLIDVASPGRAQALGCVGFSSCDAQA